MALEIGVDSFTSLTEANTYWANNSGGTNWATASDENKEKALRKASQYIDKSYRFIGYHPGGSAQLLSWPRVDVVDHQGRTRSGVPQEVKDATAYMAEQALASELRGPLERGGAIKALKAGSVEIEYEDNAPGQTVYKYVDLLLRDLIVSGHGFTKMFKK